MSHLLSSHLVLSLVFVLSLSYRHVCVLCPVLSCLCLCLVMSCLCLVLSCLVFSYASNFVVGCACFWFIQAAITSSLAPSTWTTSTFISQNNTTSQAQEHRQTPLVRIELIDVRESRRRSTRAVQDTNRSTHNGTNGYRHNMMWGVSFSRCMYVLSLLFQKP